MNPLLNNKEIVPLNVFTNGESSNKNFTPASMTNQIIAAKTLGFYSQIYNWNHTGVVIRLNLPITNADNTPLFMIKISPYFPSLNEMAQKLTRNATDTRNAYFSRPMKFYNMMRSVIVPMLYEDVVFGDRTEIGSGISIIECDDPPLISFLARHSLGWTGALSYKLKMISNVTSQGRIAISRVYDLPTIPHYGDFFKIRTPVALSGGTTRYRRDNAFMFIDLSRDDDLEIECPYVDSLPWKSIVYEELSALSNPNNGIDEPGTIDVRNSYLVADVVGTLAQSTTSSTIEFELQIKAGEDFELFEPDVIGTWNYINRDYSYASDGRPIAIGSNSIYSTDGLSTLVNV